MVKTKEKETKFDMAFQVGLLASSLKSPKYFSIIKSSTEGLNAFDNTAMSFIWEVVKHYNKNSGGIPDRFLIELEAQENGDNLELCAEVSQALDLIYKQQSLISDAGIAMSYAYKASEYANVLKVRNLHQKIGMMLKQNQDEAAYELISQFKKIDIQNIANYDFIDWHDSFLDRFQLMRLNAQTKSNMIQTGIYGIDSVLKGIELGTMFVIQGVTNRGKTALGNFIAYNQCLNKHGTLYFSGEMAAARIARRIDARHTLVDGLRFKTFDFSQRDQDLIEKYYTERADDFGGYIKICSASDSSLPGQIKQHGLPIEMIIEVCESQGHKIKDWRSVFLDSINHSYCKSVKFQTKKEMFDYLALTYDGFFESINKVGFIMAQAHRGGKAKTDNESIGESYEISRFADYVLSINEPAENSAPTQKDDIPDEEVYEGGVEQVVETGAEQREFILDMTKTRDSGHFSAKVKGILSRMLYVDDGYLSAEQDILGNRVI